MEVEVMQGSEARSLQLTVENGGKWLAERDLPQVAGCIDVDLAITPATNTLPIRRLHIPIGESREVTAAWVKFPDLAVEPLHQRYTRLTANTYHYQSDSGFHTEIAVDELGLVISYKDAWERVGS